MMSSGSPPWAGAWPVGVRLAATRGAPMLAAGMSVTPIARRLTVWWPGGGWVYAWPEAIEYLDGQRMRRARIIPVRLITMGGIVTLGAVAAVASVAQWWRRGRRNAAQTTRMWR
jgi:hypothetical protein